MSLEVCVDSIDSVCAAVEGGANRIELCSALSEGGLSPTCGFLKVAKKYTTTGRNVPIFAMLRPRRGNFQYTDTEMDIILSDLEDFIRCGVDGFVFGALNDRNEIEVAQCERVIGAASGLPVTFHRAFDLTDHRVIVATARTVQKIGFSRILTSGCFRTAELGLENIKKLCDEFKDDGDDFIVMPGAGVNVKNVVQIVEGTGCKEIHASARVAKIKAVHNENDVSMGAGDGDDEPVMVTDRDVVRKLVLYASRAQQIL